MWLVLRKKFLKFTLDKSHFITGRCKVIKDEMIINERTGKRIFIDKIKNVSIRVVFYMVVCICVCFAGNSVKDASAAEQTKYDKLKIKVIQAYKEYKSEVDVSSLDLYIDNDKSEIKEVMTEVVNKTTSIFYTSHSYSLEYAGTTRKITKIQLGYAAEYKKASGAVNESAIKKTAAKINKEVKKITAQIKTGMNNVDKALFVHDYIVKNTSYEDKASDNSRLTEYGILVNHKGNCQGYSLAYAVVMEKLGFNVRFVDSDSMGHVWNQIKLNGKWYNVDLTWDDPVDNDNGKNQDGVVYHKFFLTSDTYLKNNGYSGFEATNADNKKYDKSYFKNITSAFDYNNGKWIFMMSSGIYKRTHIDSGKAKRIYKVKGMCLIKFNSTKYYYIAYNRLYMFNLKNNKASFIWSPVKKYSNSYYITQIKYSSGKIKYYVKNPKNNKQKTGSFKVKKSGFR